MRQVFLGIALTVGGLLSTVSLAGPQYVELPNAVASKQQGKIEVVEIFSYGCGHCFKLEPSLNSWVASLPADVVFKRVPAMFGGQWDVQGQLFLTLEVMEVGPQVNHAVFQAVHDRLKLKTPEEMADFLQTVGVDRGKFLTTYHSFVVSTRVADAKNKTKAYEVSGVPAMVVNGKYRFDLGVGGAKKMFELADQLIDKERLSQ
ncbi:thiol:disulfide interchange protein [Pseudomonas protegens]|uniref:thiol:disulfide interchange protein DsbA/DsbL n=1 Tax=Pseudomonas protegens TaxID=380021 RepID=UPI000F4B6199|nr:thiol:disulfide interchange protein DsbA/DsbL [Pseudomonas protegens]ROL81463.1 thiol:disulfide interchange protein [Pseudomonas protegens]